jgi:hypothetical protein
MAGRVREVWKTRIGFGFGLIASAIASEAAIRFPLSIATTVNSVGAVVTGPVATSLPDAGNALNAATTAVAAAV